MGRLLMDYASVDFLDENATHLPVHIYVSYIADVSTARVLSRTQEQSIFYFLTFSDTKLTLYKPLLLYSYIFPRTVRFRMKEAK